MKIKFKKKRLLANLIFALVWIGLGLATLWGSDDRRWSDYGYLLIGLVYLGHYVFNFSNQYLTVENGTIRKNGLFGFKKRLNLNDIHHIKKFAGDYTLKTKQKTLVINTDVIDKDSLTELNDLLAQLNLPAEHTPFA